MLKTASSLINSLFYAGTWNASSNTPTLVSGVGVKNTYYIVSTAGTTNLDGITTWSVGDWAIFNGTVWQRIVGGSAEIFSSLTVTSLTGYMYANGNNAVTASTTIPVASVTGAVPNTVNVIAGGLITGGGALTGNVTLTLSNVPLANVTGAGTIASQNANAVAITGGTINSVAITASTLSNIQTTGLTGYLYGNSSSGNVTASTTIPTGNLSGTINLTTQVTGTLPVANGGTGVTSSSGANSVVLRDANQNITINSSFNGFTSVTASGTQITLTAASTPIYLISGSGGQVIQLPNATTLPNGVIFSFNNNQSSGAITVNNNSGTLVVSVPSGGYTTVVLLTNSTAAGTWDRHDQTPSNVSWSTNTLSWAGSYAGGGTWNGNPITNTYIANSSITLGNTSISLGSTATTINALTLTNVTVSTGTIAANVVNHTTTTAATATFATASLPLVPAGYLSINLNGTVVKVPYYAV